MASSLRIALAQLDLLVGDIQPPPACVNRAAGSLRRGSRRVSGTLTSGIPPRLFSIGLVSRWSSAGKLARDVEISAARPRSGGYPIRRPATPPNFTRRVFSCAASTRHYRKAHLPNYRVFDEKRYFTSGHETCVVELAGIRVGILICEDIWDAAPARAAHAAGAELLVVLNASPYEQRRQRERESIVRQRVTENGIPVVYVNLVGGQDELVFDGRSFVMDRGGEAILRANAFEEDLPCIDIARAPTVRSCCSPWAWCAARNSARKKACIRALCGVRDYVNSTVSRRGDGSFRRHRLRADAAIAVDHSVRTACRCDDALALYLADPSR